MRRETYHGILYEVLDINNKKLTRTQMKREWKKFIKEREYSKVKTHFEKQDGVEIETTMYFKNGKLHNEYEAAIEIILLTDIIREYHLDGKKVQYNENNWPEYVINHKRRKIVKWKNKVLNY